MNEPGRDLAPWYIPTMFKHDLRRIASGRALTCLAGQNNYLFKHSFNEPCLSWTNSAEISTQGKSLPIWPWSEENCTRESGNGVVSIDGQTDNFISVYPPSNLVEQG